MCARSTAPASTWAFVTLVCCVTGS
jgi:hypothetical protein